MVDAQPASRDAIIYVPGLLHGEERVSLEGFAMRIAASLDRNVGTREARFALSDGNVVEYREGLESKRVTIERRDADGAPQPIIDVFEFDYRDSIRERYLSRTPIRQAGAIAWLLVVHIPHFLGFMRRNGKGTGDKFQLLIASAMMLTIMLYLGVLLLTAIGTGFEALNRAGLLGTRATAQTAEPEPNASTGAPAVSDPPAVTGKASDPADSSEEPAEPIAEPEVAAVAEPEPVKPPAGATPPLVVEEVHDDFDKGVEVASRVLGADGALRNLQALIVLLTGLGLLIRGNVKQLVEDLSIEYASLINYISSLSERSELSGRFSLLLEHVYESKTSYRHIDVIGYSFGSVVAIDCVFGTTTPAVGLRGLNALVTVGSPFDIIRSFFPGYFSNRVSPGAKRMRWLNVFSPEDILSSNFRDDEEVTDVCQVGIKTKEKMEVKPTNVLFGPGTPEQKSWPWVRLFRLRELHTMYWGKSTHAKTFMADVVPKLYAADDPMLR